MCVYCLIFLYFLKGGAFCWLRSSLALPEALSKHHIPGRQKSTSMSSSRNMRSLNLSFFDVSFLFFSWHIVVVVCSKTASGFELVAGQADQSLHCVCCHSWDMSPETFVL